MTHHTPLRAVVVTGASTGIGAACARHLQGMGFLVFAGVRKREDGQALVASCHGATPAIQPILLDVTDHNSIAVAAKDVEAALTTAGINGLAGLVNNAGIAVPGPIEAVPLADARRQLDVNVLGQMAVTQAFLPLLRTARGRIVNMSSIAGRAVTPFMGWYCASKFAFEALTDALRMELCPWGIEVCSVEPGAIVSSIWERSGAEGERMARVADPARLSLYRVSLERLRQTIGRVVEGAIPADAVARVVAEALTVSRPKTRYLVGRDAKFRRWMGRLCPDRVQDRLVMKFLNLPTEPPVDASAAGQVLPPPT
ncbi:MAG: SDR family oxidoreductase [Nitrospiraceae bacterium]